MRKESIVLLTRTWGIRELRQFRRSPFHGGGTYCHNAGARATSCGRRCRRWAVHAGAWLRYRSQRRQAGRQRGRSVPGEIDLRIVSAEWLRGVGDAESRLDNEALDHIRPRPFTFLKSGGAGWTSPRWRHEDHTASAAMEGFSCNRAISRAGRRTPFRKDLLGPPARRRTVSPIPLRVRSRRNFVSIRILFSGYFTIVEAAFLALRFGISSGRSARGRSSIWMWSAKRSLPIWQVIVEIPGSSGGFGNGNTWFLRFLITTVMPRRSRH